MLGQQQQQLCHLCHMPAVEMSIRVYENSVLKVLPRVVSTKVSTKYRDTFGIAIPKSIEAYAIPVSWNFGIAIYRSIVSFAHPYSVVATKLC